MAVALAHREFLSTPKRPPIPPPEYMANWREALPVGTLIGDSGAEIHLLEFADLQCPACRGYQSVIRKVEQRFPREVAVTFVDFPLSYHKQAVAAAGAAECAQRLGRFKQFTEAVYAKQESLGTKSWASYAEDAGIHERNQFERCLADTSRAGASVRSKLIGERFGIDATPTVIVSGWRYRVAPDLKTLETLFEQIRSGVRRPPRNPALGLAAIAGVTHQVNDTTMVDHDAPDLARARHLTLERGPILRLGGANGDPAFDISDARSYALLPHGQVATFAPRASELFIFDSTGRGAKRLGRHGRGPGEFSGVPAMWLRAPDTLLLIDFGNGRIDWALPDRGVVRSVPIDQRIPRQTQRLGGVLRSGALVLSSSGRMQSGILGRVTRPTAALAVVPLDGPGKVVATIPDVETIRVRTRYGGRAGNEDLAIGYARVMHVVAWDSLIATGTGDGYRIDLRDSTGHVVRAIRVAVRRRPVTDAMRRLGIQQQLERLRSMAHGSERPRDPAEGERLARELPYADSLPPYSAFFVSPNETLWVVDAIGPADSGWSATAFGFDGAILGRIHGDAGQPVAFGDHRVLVRKMDVDGIVSLEVHRIVAQQSTGKP